MTNKLESPSSMRPELRTFGVATRRLLMWQSSMSHAVSGGHSPRPKEPPEVEVHNPMKEGGNLGEVNLSSKVIRTTGHPNLEKISDVAMQGTAPKRPSHIQISERNQSPKIFKDMLN